MSLDLTPSLNCGFGVGRMVRVSKLMAVLLMALWLPATMCCSLEAAGLKVGQSSACCDDEDTTKPVKDNCRVVEDGHYVNAVPAIKVIPALTAITLFEIPIFPLCIEPQIQEIAARCKIAESRDWIPIWQFDRRTAAPANSPDLLNA
ncbi:MAG: hypothetical protein HYV95_09935 [Opitutae bacterium]|nr:hypothetical protein [Opitutae bacterium]